MSVLYHLQGWYETNTEGIGTIYLAITDEGVLTTPTDTPASADFRPRIKNPEQFSIKRMATYWPWGNTQDSFAAYGTLEIDNYDGAFDFMMAADLRDAPCVFKIVNAKMMAANNTIANGLVVATCIIDDISCNSEDVIQVTFKDTLSTLDVPLPVRFNWGFWDSNAANQMVPMTFGACRNRQPQLIAQDGADGSGQPLYRIHDVAIGNIAQVRDEGAILDVTASPPQVVPALGGSGIQLQTLPVGKLLVDASNIGTQVIPPAAVDELGGAGTLATWPVSGSPPTGWTYQTSPPGTFLREGTTQGLPDFCMGMLASKDIYNPTGSKFGMYANLTTAFMNSGQTYRIRFTLDRMTTAAGIPQGGFMVRTDLTFQPTGDVSGSGFGPYLISPQFADQQYSFEYKCPNDGTTRTLYMILVGGGASNPAWSAVWHGLTVELLGQFTEEPLQAITLGDFYNEILYLRAYQDSASWSAADLALIDATFKGFGIAYDSPPNIYRDCILGPLPTCCADAFTDATGLIRVRQLGDPKLATPVAAFDMTNTVRPIQIAEDAAQYLTTLMGARRNWTISGPSDFVTDYALVPADVRARYSRTSQYQVTSTKTPAGKYSHAIGSPVFDTLFDDPADAQVEIDRVVGLYSAQIYADGTIFNGKRRFVTFTLLFDDAGVLGDQSVGALTAPGLLIGDTVLFSYSHADGTAMFSSTPIFVAGTELFPFGNKLIVTGWC
jgi:hypothetical protein